MWRWWGVLWLASVGGVKSEGGDAAAAGLGSRLIAELEYLRELEKKLTDGDNLNEEDSALVDDMVSSIYDKDLRGAKINNEVRLRHVKDIIHWASQIHSRTDSPVEKLEETEFGGSKELQAFAGDEVSMSRSCSIASADAFRKFLMNGGVFQFTSRTLVCPADLKSKISVPFVCKYSPSSVAFDIVTCLPKGAPSGLEAESGVPGVCLRMGNSAVLPSNCTVDEILLSATASTMGMSYAAKSREIGCPGVLRPFVDRALPVICKEDLEHPRMYYCLKPLQPIPTFIGIQTVSSGPPSINYQWWPVFGILFGLVLGFLCSKIFRGSRNGSTGIPHSQRTIPMEPPRVGFATTLGKVVPREEAPTV